MRIKSRFLLMISGLLMGVLVLGVFTLVQWRFETGDMYPRLSSLRSDPLGARVLYETFNAYDEVRVERNFNPWDSTLNLRGGTVFFLNFDPAEAELWGENPYIIDFVASGGRVVFGLNPERRPSYFKYDEQASNEETVLEKEARENALANPSQESFERISSLSDSLELVEISDLKYHQTARFAEETLGKPGSLLWRKRFAFERGRDVWEPLLSIDEHVVATYRNYGRGSIVMFGDDYLFSNEALYLRRDLELFHWLLAGSDTVIFDEAHFGIVQTTGIVDLVKKYKLFPVILVGFLFLFAWIWKNAVPLLPPHSDGDPSAVVAESSSDHGLSELINRFLPAQEQPLRAFELWEKSVLSNPAEALRYQQELKNAREAIAAFKNTDRRKRDPQSLYFQLKNIINSQNKARV